MSSKHKLLVDKASEFDDENTIETQSNDSTELAQ